MKLAFSIAVLAGSVLIVSCMTPQSTDAASAGAASLPAAATGANVDESKVQDVLFVDNQNPAASDSNPGTEARPFLTVSQGARAAVADNQRGIGVKVYIKPGIYREQVAFPQTGNETPAAMIFEGTVRGSVILAGSDVWTGWQQVNGNLYQHPWPYTWGIAPYPPGWDGNTTLEDIVRRREMVFVNGHTLSQSLSYSNLTDYSFFVDETAHILYVQLGSSMSMNGATVEVAIRPRIFTVDGKTNFVLRDLVFKHGNAAVQDPAVSIMDSNNVLVEGCSINWNNWIGLALSNDSNMTLSNDTGNNNGGEGFDVYNMKNLVLDGNETSYNNWRGARGNFFGWSVTGAKIGGVHVGRVSHHVSALNRARGLWLDYDNRDFTVDGLSAVWNYNDGIFIEANPGPILVQNSTFANNQGAAGIAGANSSDVTLLNNAITGNTAEQILITGDLDRTVVNWETNGQQNVQATRWTIRSNTMTSQGSSQALMVVTQNWPPFLTTLSADYNIWMKAGGQQAFQVGSSWLSFTQWQSLVNADSTSVFQQ